MQMTDGHRMVAGPVAPEEGHAGSQMELEPYVGNAVLQGGFEGKSSSKKPAPYDADIIAP